MKKITAAILIGLMMIVTGCGSGNNYEKDENTCIFTDSCGRQVEIPEDITRVAPSGSTSEMVLMTIAPDFLVGLSSTPSKDKMKYYPEEMWKLPTFGQFYGSKANLNMESLIAAKPQVIIDIGDMKDGHKRDMDTIQKQTGIPVLFIEATIDKFPEAYRTLGEILDREEKGEALASFIEETIDMASENSAKVTHRKKVYYGTGSSAMAANAAGSIQSDVIDIVGAVNAIQVPEDEITNKGGGTLVNMEELYNADPDIILVTEGGPYEKMKDKNNSWSGLDAVKRGEYYEIPALPYCWMSGPPSVNRILGIWWLGCLAYPEIYDYDMVEITEKFYSLFWNYELTEEEAEAFLLRSTLKQER